MALITLQEYWSQQAIINAQHKKIPPCVICHKRKGERTIHGEWVCLKCRPFNKKIYVDWKNEKSE